MAPAFGYTIWDNPNVSWEFDHALEVPALPLPAPPRLMSSPEITVWRFVDGKPGHEKQSLGLVNALARLTRVQRHDLPARTELKDWLLGRLPASQDLAAPDLIVGAGHACHLPMLAARRLRGGKAVVLMSPSLPTRWFDLCLIPEHDHPLRRDNVIVTLGAINAAHPESHDRSGRGLILVGGNSPHYVWDSLSITRQVLDIVNSTPDTAWRLTTSRRTPADFVAQLARQAPANLESLTYDATPPGWLENALLESERVWVSEDSVSMLYEALTAGAATGLLRLPTPGTGRVADGIQRLIDDGWITPYSTWRQTNRLIPPPAPLDEATRCARIILERWFQHAL